MKNIFICMRIYSETKACSSGNFNDKRFAYQLKNSKTIHQVNDVVNDVGRLLVKNI